MAKNRELGLKYSKLLAVSDAFRQAVGTSSATTKAKTDAITKIQAPAVSEAVTENRLMRLKCLLMMEMGSRRVYAAQKKEVDTLLSQTRLVTESPPSQEWSDMARTLHRMVSS